MGKLTDTFQQVREAGKSLAFCGEEKINEVLRAVADATESQAGQILSENAKDLARMDESDPKYDRLKLTTERIHGIAEGIRSVTRLPSPVGRVLSETLRPNGMKLTKVSVPFGVIGIVYEARPNVTLDVFSLCFKSGNACLLKGGSDADCSNRAIVSVIHSVLIQQGLNPNLVVLLPPDRESAAELLNARGYVDLLIPRGGKGLIDFVRRNATVPVIETGAGVCHAYFDRSGDVTKGAAIIRNAPNKTLIYVVQVLPEVDEQQIDSKEKYFEYYKLNEPFMKLTMHQYPQIKDGGAVIINDYEKFIDKVFYTIKSR